ncbi:MAG: efflux transporter outer membrane subunit [Pseudomonadota bacterium]
MRSHIIILLCLVLSSCVNYAGIHGNSKPLDNGMLNTSYSTDHYQKISANTADWWLIYRDPQLNKLINTALKDSPSLQIAQSRLSAARHIAEAAGSRLWPQVDATGSIQRERLTENTFFPPPFGGNSYTETNVGLNFNWELDFFGKNRAIIAARTNEARAAQAEVAEARLILAAAVASDYFNLQLERISLKIFADIVKQRKEMLGIIKVQAKHGIASDIPITTASAELQVAQETIAQLQEQYQITIHKLAALVGMNPFIAELKVNHFSYNKNIFRLPKVIPANFLARRPDIIASRWRMEAAAAQVKAAKARFYPNVNLIALWSYQSFILSKAFDSASRDSYFGAAIDLPIFDAGRRRAELATQYAEFDTAQEQYNETILNALRDTADQIATLHTLHRQEAEQVTAFKDAQKNYQLTKARYHNGINDYMSVLNSKESLYIQQNALILLQTQHLKATVAMIKALGGNYLRLEA